LGSILKIHLKRGFLLGLFDKTQKPNPAPKKSGFFHHLSTQQWAYSITHGSSLINPCAF